MQDLRLIKKEPLISLAHGMMVYPTPANISYLWAFGSIAGICLVVQIITGVILAMHYTPHIDYAFISVEHIMRDVNYGWLIRYFHANGASMFFIVVYVHMFRGLYYGSYGAPRGEVWLIGVTIYLAMMATAFLGYVLPWGQMSFWGATVITNFFSAFPVVGDLITVWLWGGFSVDNATLNRFFSLHFLLPFVIAALSLAHIALLHGPKSGNPLGLDSKVDRIPFHPYFTVKDLFGFVAFAMFFSYFVYFNPNMLGHPDNYIPANPMVTPAHIVPEWYYLPSYAILRSIPDKLGGVCALFGSILVFYLLPFINTSQIRSSSFRPIHKKFYWLFVVCCLLLGWVGGNAAEAPYTHVGLVCTIYYFTYLIILIPLIGSLENALLQLGHDEELLKEVANEDLNNKKVSKASDQVVLLPVRTVSSM